MKAVINIGFVGRLSAERSPGLFLHAAKHLLDALSSGAAISTCATPRQEEEEEQAIPTTGIATRQTEAEKKAAAAGCYFSGRSSASATAAATHNKPPSPASSASSSAGELSTGDNSQQAIGSGSHATTRPEEVFSENESLPGEAIAASAAAAAAAAGRIVFKVAGAGVLAEHLVALSQQLGLSDRVEFVGAVEAADMPAFLRSLDIVINPCVCEFIFFWV